MAYRLDMGTQPLRPPVRMPDGRLVLDAIITRAGVFSYFENGREVRELRLPEDVFSPRSLETYALAPVTNDHPPRLLTAKNMRDHTVGALGPVRRDGDVVRGSLAIYDAEVIGEMERGKQSVSAGYDVDVDNRAGEHPQYGRYDRIQRNIRVNHVAIVDAGRAGPEARVRMDSLSAPVGVLVSYQRQRRPMPVAMLAGHMIGAMRAPRRHT
jgi:uncharacterized protein